MARENPFFAPFRADFLVGDFYSPGSWSLSSFTVTKSDGTALVLVFGQFLYGLGPREQELEPCHPGGCRLVIGSLIPAPHVPHIPTAVDGGGCLCPSPLQDGTALDIQGWPCPAWLLHPSAVRGGDVAAALRQAVWHLGFCVCLGEWGGSQVGCLSNKWIGVDDSESFD